MYVVLFIVVINALLGTLVFVRNPRSRVNGLFLLIVAFICFWALTNYFTDHSPEHIRLFLDRASFVFPVLVSGTLAFLSRIFPVPMGYSKKITGYISIITVLGIYISISGLVVKSITIAQNGSTNSVPGTLYNFYSFLVVILLFGYAVRNYFVSRKRADTIQRLQSSYVAVGFLISFFWALIVSVLLPIYIPKWNTAELGPDGTIVFVAASAYAIVRHRLFDIRLIVARSIAYILTLSSIALLCIIPAILIATHLLHSSLETGSIASLVVITFIAVIIFQPLKNRFDKISNKLFFRDYYEPQEVIDKLGNLLVGISDVHHILKGSHDILTTSINPQFLEFILLDKELTNVKHVKNEEIIHKLLNVKFDIITTDNLDKATDKSLYDYLHEHDIAVVIGLRTSKENLGYMLLGYKQSGNIYNSVDERLLGIAADEIAISLQNALRFEQIQQFNITLQAKVDEATKELKKTNEKLKALDETKDDFISMASHQLRTPLSIIKGYVNMVANGDTGKVSQQQKDFLDQALVSSETMVRLVTELLNVSRITSGKFSVDTSAVNLADIVENEIQQLTNMANERKIDLVFLKPKDFPVLMLDEEKIRQVIANFIDNAIHYSKDKGAKINVQLTDADDIVFEVIDNGIGVPASEKEHLFTKFYRAKNAKEARPNGTGVGIYLAKVVVNELGGDLIFESKEGVGSTFGFRFKKDKIVHSGGKS